MKAGLSYVDEALGVCFDAMEFWEISFAVRILVRRAFYL
jgi:hypothetical protein